MREEGLEPGAELTLRASLFGEFRLWTSDDEPFTLQNRRASLILAILSLQPNHSIERAALAKLLWPDRFDAQAKASLRQCLLDLRKALEDHRITGLTVTRGEVGFDPAAFSCDLRALESSLETDAGAATDHLRSIGNQSLLQTSSLNPEFDAWLASRREHTDTRLKAAIAKAADGLGDETAQALLDAARLRFPGLQRVPSSAERVTMAILPFSQTDEIGGAFFLSDAILDELSLQYQDKNRIDFLDP